MTVAAVTDVKNVIDGQNARKEVEVPPVAGVVRGKRTRPIAAVAANVVELVVITVASSRQEERVTVARSEESAVDTVLGCTRDVGVVHLNCLIDTAKIKIFLGLDV